MQRTTAGDGLIALLLLTYPALALLFDGAASALMIAAAVLSLGALLARRSGSPVRLDGLGLALCIALAAPVAAVALSTLAHGHPTFPVWDSPSRFLFVIPVFLALRRASLRPLAWADLGFPVGALATLVVALFLSRDWSNGEHRIGSLFLDPIHFGDLALAFGVLSAMALNWWRKDKTWVVALKIAGLVAGLAASLLSGSRGGWVALPFVLAIVLWERSRGKSLRWKVLMPLVVVALFGIAYGASSTVRDRTDVTVSNLMQYQHGHEDTSVGVRLQLYKAALELFQEHPVLGLGGHGFRDAMNSMAQQGKLTPLAADLGKGEVHNQVLAYMADYGIVGGLALLAIYVVPALFFARLLESSSGAARGAAMLGLLFVVMFFVFGLTVETFDLKSPVSIYALIVAALAGIADRAHHDASNASSFRPSCSAS
jgi:O-antigen ligase